MQEINPNDIRLVAMNLLARREHLRSELTTKLSRRFNGFGDSKGKGKGKGNGNGTADAGDVDAPEAVAATDTDVHFHDRADQLDDQENKAALIEQVLDELEAENLLSDERFTESYIRSRGGRGYGPDRIRQELRQKGLDATLLEDVLSSIDLDWVEIAVTVREKKFRATVPTDFKEKAKQLRFLNYRGFGSEYATAAVELAVEMASEAG